MEEEAGSTSGACKLALRLWFVQMISDCGSPRVLSSFAGPVKLREWQEGDQLASPGLSHMAPEGSPSTLHSSAQRPQMDLPQRKPPMRDPNRRPSVRTSSTSKQRTASRGRGRPRKLPAMGRTWPVDAPHDASLAASSKVTLPRSSVLSTIRNTFLNSKNVFDAENLTAKGCMKPLMIIETGMN